MVVAALACPVSSTISFRSWELVWYMQSIICTLASDQYVTNVDRQITYDRVHFSTVTLTGQSTVDSRQLRFDMNVDKHNGLLRPK